MTDEQRFKAAIESADANSRKVTRALNDAGFVIIRGDQVEAYDRAAKALPRLLLHSEKYEGEVRREAYAAIDALNKAGL